MSEVGFIEVLFGFKVDHTRLLREQAVCTTCGLGGFHTHLTAPVVARPAPQTEGERDQ